MKKKKVSPLLYFFLISFLILTIFIFSRGFLNTIEHYDYVKSHYKTTIIDKEKLEKQIKDLEKLKNKSVETNQEPSENMVKKYRIDIRGVESEDSNKDEPFNAQKDTDIKVIPQ